MCNFTVETLDFPWGGHLARLGSTGETPIPQDFRSSCTSRNFEILKALVDVAHQRGTVIVSEVIGSDRATPH